MSDRYTAAVLERAAKIAALERAADQLMQPRRRWDVRAGLVAALAALMSLMPAVSAAQCLL